jgi:acetylornithine deacetylase ArgE
MEAVDIAKELIRFDTSGPPAKERPCAEWIKDFLEDNGIESTLQIVEKDRANLVGKIGEGKGPGLVLSGHIDVVLAGNLELWEISDPFNPVIHDGKMYGRGACDMKGPDACILQAVKEIAKENFRRQLNVVFTAGEDTSGWYVTKVLDEKLITIKDASYGIVPEPSLMEIIPIHKGTVDVKVKISGKASHSSRPVLGINANQKAADFLLSLRTLQEELNRTRHPLLGPTTVECTMMKGGFKKNIIPDSANLTINIRLIPEHKEPVILRKWFTDTIGELSSDDPEFNAEFTTSKIKEPLNVPLDSEIVQFLIGYLGTEPTGAPYYTEAVDYTKAGIPTVICGPGDISQAHTADEWISLDQLKRGVKTFKEAIRHFCL